MFSEVISNNICELFLFKILGKSLNNTLSSLSLPSNSIDTIFSEALFLKINLPSKSIRRIGFGLSIENEAISNNSFERSERSIALAMLFVILLTKLLSVMDHGFVATSF